MKKTLILGFVGALALSTGAFAAPHTVYKQCNISDGRVGTCEAAYSGQAVVSTVGSLKNPVIKNCAIDNGKITQCDSVYSGEVPVQSLTGVNHCEVKSGQPLKCMGPFSGKTVLRIEE